MFQLNQKKDTLNILINYFKKIDINEIGYYLNNNNNIKIPYFLESNIYNPEDIELINLLMGHLKIAVSKVFYLTTPFNLDRTPIKLSFITDLIYWEEIFVIENTIFISYPYLKRIFEKIEYNNYDSVDSIYFSDDKIFDLKLLKKIGECLQYVVQFLNFEYWENYICDRYSCLFVDKSNIKFLNEYKILKDINTSFLIDKITVYWLNSGEIYGIINSICSNLSYSPYWETKYIKLSYLNGEYVEISNNEKNYSKEDYKNTLNKINLHTNPFALRAKQLTEHIIHNK